ncbi:Rab11 family-interacting protein 4 [Galemys pyrenaicus]|uniref:Rab11 family-interacting protein 4 n=1 Tax=Galemys pyrenaicus TaxID=202257 RepID=A0A8J6AVI7_GALPY|nr:Rab11 family-interacting protein 4 [Galemys pyrenaicus]
MRDAEPCRASLPHSVPLFLSQGSEVPGPTFADGELVPVFFPEEEEEAMMLAPPEGPPESDMDSPMESTQSLEGSVGSPAEEKDGGLGALFLPEDK